MRVSINGKVFDTLLGDVITLELAGETERNAILGTLLLSTEKRVTINPVMERPRCAPSITRDVLERNSRALGTPAALFSEREAENAWKFIDRIREGAKV